MSKHFYEYQHGNKINVDTYDELEWMAHWAIVNRTIDACDTLLPLVDPDLAKHNRSGFESWIVEEDLRQIRSHYSKILQQLDELQRRHKGIDRPVEI